MALERVTAKAWEVGRDRFLPEPQFAHPFGDEWQAAVASIPPETASSIINGADTTTRGAEIVVEAVKSAWLASVKDTLGWAPTGAKPGEITVATRQLAASLVTALSDGQPSHILSKQDRVAEPARTEGRNRTMSNSVDGAVEEILRLSGMVITGGPQVRVGMTHEEKEMMEAEEDAKTLELVERGKLTEKGHRLADAIAAEIAVLLKDKEVTVQSVRGSLVRFLKALSIGSEKSELLAKVKLLKNKVARLGQAGERLRSRS